MKQAVAEIMGRTIAGPCLGLLLAVAGCRAVGPDYKTPGVAVPAAWTGSAAAGGDGKAAAGTDDAAVLSRWWEVFRDPVLSDLVEQARLNNRDVRQAEARVRQARAQRNLAKAEQLPTLGVSASATRSRSSETTGMGQTSSLYANGFDAAWEADLFGGKRRAAEAAQASFEASREELRDVMVTLFSEVALNYVDYRSYQARLAITEAGVAAQTETYDLARWRQEANLVTQLDVDQARLSLEKTRAELPALRTGRDQAEHQLATLLGRAPGSLAAQLDGVTPVPEAAAEPSLGVPADLLRRRPDVRKKECDLAAQTAQIGVAEAARYPDLTLSGSIGLEALTRGDLYTAAARTAAGAVKAGWTLFDGGQIRQKVAVQTALQEEALAAYEGAVLAAVQEVEDALTSHANEQERRRALLEAVKAGESAFKLARAKYESGLIDFETVLSTQQALLTVQDSQAASTAATASGLIRLYKALGGGWDPLAPATDGTKGNP